MIFSQFCRDNPYAMEAILALIELGVNPADLISLYGNSRTSVVEWMEQLMHAHKLQHKYDYKGSLVVYSTLENQFVNNVSRKLEHFDQH